MKPFLIGFNKRLIFGYQFFLYGNTYSIYEVTKKCECTMDIWKSLEFLALYNERPTFTLCMLEPAFLSLVSSSAVPPRASGDLRLIMFFSFLLTPSSSFADISPQPLHFSIQSKITKKKNKKAYFFANKFCIGKKNRRIRHQSRWIWEQGRKTMQRDLVKDQKNYVEHLS